MEHAVSALAGLVRFDSIPADAASVSRMIDCVPHRGTDWRGVWAHDSASLAYRWRRTGPSQPVDRQPLVDSHSGVAVVMDGRLDNRGELCDRLDVDNVDQLSDAQLVLSAYARWDVEAVTFLLGDFAFGLWDPRTRHMHLVRDALGMRGLSFTEGPDFVAFATEPRQLLRVNGIDRRPNLGFLAEWVAGRMTHPSQTIFAGIERVQPAHIVTFTPGGRRTSRYWDIDPQREVRYRDDRDYVAHFRSLYRVAVGARLRGLDQVGVFLSGGLDSSSLVAMAAHAENQNRPVAMRAYSLTCDGLPDGDDEQSASTVAHFCRVPLACVPFRHAGVEFYVKMAQTLEDTIPSAVGDGRAVLARQAAADGCRVLLDGTGGDEWFSGAYQHAADLLKAGRLLATVRQLRAAAQTVQGHSAVELARSSVWALVPERLRAPLKRVLPRRDRMPRGFSRAFATRVGLVERITTPLRDRRFASIATGTAYATATHPITSYAWEEIARHDELCGVELAAPLMDRRLAEFAMGIPEEQRWLGTQSKRVLRDAMAGLLPDSTIRRPKADAASAQLSELQSVHDAGLFQSMELVDEGVLERAAVSSMYREMLDLFAAADTRYKMLADQLWTIVLGECIWRALFGRNAVRVTIAEPACKRASVH
jgi:asparagine synthase (glutamine-hydrolysing)